MNRSTERILTTHSGSLVRTREIVEGMKARTLGTPHDDARVESDIERGKKEVVRKQVDVGIDIPNDGEYGRRVFTSYVHERLKGLTPRSLDPGEVVLGQQSERADFPEFYEQYRHHRYEWMYPEISMTEVASMPANLAEWFRVTGPIAYTGQKAVESDINALKSALVGLNVADAFMTAVTPVSRKSDKDVLSFYPSYDAYFYALADAMHEEYKAITDAGLILQLDYAVFNPQEELWRATSDPDEEQLRRGRDFAVEVTNHALRGIPEDRVRYHHCWGSSNRPHTRDLPFRDFAQQMLRLNVQAYGIEAANPRHEYEWMVWQDVKLPEGKILIPGVISQSTNVVEHPETVAWRIKNFASVVGKENVIAGVDCGFSQSWDWIRVHPSIQWAKLKALSDGAALASKDLWPSR